MPWRIVLLAMLSSTGAAAVESTLVRRVDGRLVYAPFSDRGDTVPDFSTCGYLGGGSPLPQVPVRLVVEPDGDQIDDLPRLQAAIDQVSALPPREGVRGAVLLRRGRYYLSGSLRLAAAGVVLRGEGDGEDDTVLVATRRAQHSLIVVSGEGAPAEVAGTRQPVTDAYVPVGSTHVTVADASGFRAGDTIIVHRPSTAEWIAVLGMDRIPERSEGLRQWTPGSRDLPFQRVVTAVEGDRISFDAPLVNALQAEFGGGSVYRYEWPGRIEQVGVEHLRGESEFDPAVQRNGVASDEAHGWVLIQLNRCRDAWVRGVTSRWFGYSCVGIDRLASRVTVLDSSCLDPVSQVAGGRRYSFAVTGSQNLVRRCFAREGRHDFVMHSVVAGPNVFVDCRAERARSDSGPHHRWATGTLYDNVRIEGNDLDVEDRQWSGTGHGWAGAMMIFWNCAARRILCQQPPTSQNFAIGCLGEKGRPHYVERPDGWWESHGVPVEPASLWRAQVIERFGAMPD